MNTKMIRYILCRMLGVESVLLMIPVIVAALYQEMSGIAFLIPAGILLLLFFLAGVKKQEQSHIYGKEGMVIVALAWILWSLFGAMPFTISGFIPNYMDAFFETVSGFISDLIIRLIADCEMCKFLAALLKLFCSATSIKYFR